MADTVFSAARKLKERQGKVKEAILKSDQQPRKKKPSKPRKRATPNVKDILKNERVGSNGERSFGAPIDRQSTDSNNP